MYVRRTRFSCFFCVKFERTIVAQDYAKFTHLIVFGTKFVPLEMKTFVNIGNSFWMVITLFL